jgi:hypothetical protein
MLLENASVGEDVGLDEGDMGGGVRGKVVEIDITVGGMDDVGVWAVRVKDEILVGV